MQLAVWVLSLPLRYPKVAGALALFLLSYAVGVSLADAYGTGTGVRSHPKVTQLARKDIPAGYRELFTAAEERYGVSRLVLAGIYKIESDHGQSTAPGVRSGVNRFGCCAGPGQFHIRNGHNRGIRGSTWDRYGDGIRAHVYQGRYAVPATARLLKANSYGDKTSRPGYRRCQGIKAPPGTINALRHYNNACWYVRDVLAWAERYRTGRFS